MLENPSFTGNPFDLEAWAEFVHPESGERRRTPLFFAGGTSSCKPYRELPLGRFETAPRTWTCPYRSDWAVAVGTAAIR